MERLLNSNLECSFWEVVETIQHAYTQDLALCSRNSASSIFFVPVIPVLLLISPLFTNIFHSNLRSVLYNVAKELNGPSKPCIWRVHKKKRTLVILFSKKFPFPSNPTSPMISPSAFRSRLRVQAVPHWRYLLERGLTTKEYTWMNRRV